MALNSSSIPTAIQVWGLSLRFSIRRCCSRKNTKGSPRNRFYFSRATLGAGLLVVATAVIVAGCASTMAKIIPIGQPVTRERCEQIDLKRMGLQDGREGQRSGDKFEFWVKDCASFGVRFDRSLYDAGYEEGLRFYCSCGNGFLAGVKDELAEARGQYLLCDRNQFTEFLNGHKEGLNFKADPVLVKKKDQFTNLYDEKAIFAKAGMFCGKF
ncbi:MAG: hypothetical protein C5B49_15755 [Bdellovibrio sp.]|nr:MAG: hypothetical protein C5B49_15755 [Bdellovibrio sp.]